MFQYLRFCFVIVFLSMLPNSFAQTNIDEITHIIPGSNLNAYTYTFENHLKLIVIPDYRSTLGTVHFILNAGSDREQKGSTGLAHFFEHMMFRKTEHQPEGHYDRVLSSVGGSGNAGTGDSLVTYYSNFPAPALDYILQLESERFLNLSLKNPYFDIEKGAVISERKLRLENNPVQRGYEVIRSVTERETPREWMVIGNKYDVEHLNIKTANEFYKTFYTPDNTIMVIGGPFEPQKIKEQVKTYFGKWTGHSIKNDPIYPKDYLTRDLGKTFLCSEPIATKNIQFTYPSYDKSVNSVVYSWLFEAMLNDSPDGSFEYQLQQKNLANAFMLEKSYYGTKSNPIIAHFILSEKQDIQAVEKFWNENIKRVLRTPLSKKIIAQVIKQQKVYNANVAEKLTSVVNLVIDNAYFYDDPGAQETQMQILQSVQPQEFASWTQKTFSEKKYYISGIVPPKDAKPCESMPFKTVHSKS